MDNPINNSAAFSSSVAMPVDVMRVWDESSRADQDFLAVEEPLEIRLHYPTSSGRRQRTLSVTMRTPGHDRELTAGFLLTEGVVQARRDLIALHACRGGNRVRAHLAEHVVVPRIRLKRNFFMTSSCGLCGKASIESVRVCTPPVSVSDQPQLDPQVIHRMPERLRSAQALFSQTGGLHACGLFRPDGELVSLREDVGRHNALDKLIGRALLEDRVPLSKEILLVSGRASFELVQKAAVAGIPVLAAIGAPSSLAVQLAVEQGMTLLGFVRQNRFNIYSGAERISGMSSLQTGRH